jgi:NADH dehydrogenase
MDIIVIGAGYGGITAALKLDRLFRRQADCKIHLIDRNPYHTLKTQLHEAAVRKTSVSIPIRDIIKNRHILFHQSLATGIDLERRLVFMESGNLSFDFLVFALGSQANFYDIPGLQEYSFPLQTADDAERIYRHIIDLCDDTVWETDQERRRNRLRFVIGGGGLSGVEFAAELKEHATLCVKSRNPADQADVEVVIIEGMGRILPAMEEAVVARIEQRLQAKEIKILTDTKITRLTPDTVSLSTGKEIKTETLVWTGGIMVSPLARECGLKVGAMGRIVVDEFLRAQDSPFVYAIGDNALATNPETGRPVPTAAQFALQQGRLVAENIHTAATGGKLKPYHPKVLGEIVSLGRHLAVGWMALPLIKKITFFGFLASLLKSAAEEKHLLLLRKESRNWIRY